MEKLCLESISDDGVLERVEVLARRSNELTAELLAYLGEVDARGLHLGQACTSLFVFCVERLHMSESAAGKRITAPRVARRFPAVLEMIARGDIHLTAINMLAAHLTEANHREVLARARHRSKREIEKLVAEIAPRPDVPSKVVALPRPAAAQEVHAPERVACAPESVASRRPALVAPLSPRRYEIRVTVDEETHGVLRQLQDLLVHQVPDRDPAVIVSRALGLLLERTLARKAALTDRPRDAATSEERRRHIPAAVRNRGSRGCADGAGRASGRMRWGSPRGRPGVLPERSEGMPTEGRARTCEPEGARQRHLRASVSARPPRRPSPRPDQRASASRRRRSGGATRAGGRARTSSRRRGRGPCARCP